MISIFWMLLHAAIPAAFIVAVAIWGKRVGGAGPWLLAGIAAMDAFLIVAFRVLDFFLPRHASPETIETSFGMLRMLDVAAMFLSGILALVACFLLMPKERR